MCVWCAGVGIDDAAFELMECGKRIEGFWSGYFTGLVTAGKEKFHCGKVKGASFVWEKEFSVKDFHGTAGLFHSRTNSGGDRHYAHPFVSGDGEVALVSQGIDGVFAPLKGSNEGVIGSRMLARGFKFDSASFDEEFSRYPQLSDGSYVHVSEIVVNAVAAKYADGASALEALSQTACEIPEEGVNAVIFRKEPDRIYYSTVNQRLVYCEYGSGRMLSSSALAFAPRRRCSELPPNSVGYVSADEVYSRRLNAEFKIFEELPEHYLAAVLEYIRANDGVRFAEIADNVFWKLIPEKILTIRSLLVHSSVEKLLDAGLISLHSTYDQAAKSALTKVYAV